MDADGRIEGYVWWCGDPVCDCTQAQIIRWLPGAHGWHAEQLWAGTYIASGYDEDRALNEAELREAALRFGLVEAGGKWVEAGDGRTI